MYCSQCGTKKNKSKDAFCSHCGASFAVPSHGTSLPPPGNEASRSADRDLDTQHTALCDQITFLATGNVTTTFNHALQVLNPTTLAAVDRSIGLLRSFLADAQRFKEGGRPAAHDRLTAVLDDLKAGRATLAERLKMFIAKDREDTIAAFKTQNEIVAIQKKPMDERFTQVQNQAKENGKLL